MKNDYLLECINSLKNTGPNGFEGLIRDLLERWTGQKFRLARSGSQSGKDATSENINGCVIAAEMKCYNRRTVFSSRMLSGELSEAVTSLPNLDLWVLASTKEIGDKEAQSLRVLSEKLNVEILIIDSRDNGVGPLQAFCAGYPYVTASFCINNGNDVDRQILIERLNEIRSHQNFNVATDQSSVRERSQFGVL